MIIQSAASLERKMLMFNYFLARLLLDLSSLRRSEYELQLKETDQMPGGTNHKGPNRDSLMKV